MRCEEFNLFVEQYLDGELDDPTAGRVAVHMADCEPCAAHYEMLEREQALFAGYQRDVEVTPALWQAVAAKKIQDDKTPRTSRLVDRLRAALRLLPGFGQQPQTARFAFAAALALAVIAGGVALVALRPDSPVQGPVAGGKEPPAATPAATAVPVSPGKPTVDTPNTPPVELDKDRPRPPRTPRPAAAPRAPEAKPLPIAEVRSAEGTYLQAISVLSRDLERRRGELDQTSLEHFEQSISDIDRTIATTRKAAHENPGDPVVLKHMMSAYSAKVDALRTMVD